MKKISVACRLCVPVLAAAMLLPFGAHAQNVALVNGKAVPKARVDALMEQVTRSGQPMTPELEKQVRDEVVLREMFMQEAEKRGLNTTAEYKNQLEFARQTSPDFASCSPTTPRRTRSPMPTSPPSTRSSRKPRAAPKCVRGTSWSNRKTRRSR